MFNIIKNILKRYTLLNCLNILYLKQWNCFNQSYGYCCSVEWCGPWAVVPPLLAHLSLKLKWVFDHLLSCVSLSVCKLFKFYSSDLEPLGQFQQNLQMASLGEGDLKFVKLNGHALIEREMINSIVNYFQKPLNHDSGSRMRLQWGVEF